MALTRPKFAQFDTTITSITDPQLILNRNSTVSNVDIGFVFNRDGGASANTAIIWQESSLSFVLATTSNSGVTNSNIVLTDYANLKVSNLIANSGIYTDNLYFANGSPYSVGGGGGSSYDQSLNTTDDVTFDDITANVVTANVFIGDGSQLTGITTDATSITNGASNVKAYSNSNVTVSVNGTANVVTVTSNTLYTPNIYLANSQGGSGATIWYNPDSSSIDFVIG